MPIGQTITRMREKRESERERERESKRDRLTRVDRSLITLRQLTCQMGK